MHRILAVLSVALLAISLPAAAADVTTTNKMISRPMMPRQTVAKHICSDQHTASIGSASTDCTPYACNGATGNCRIMAANTDQCADGYLYWATDHSCQRCPPDGHSYWDDASHSCKPGQMPH